MRRRIPFLVADILKPHKNTKIWPISVDNEDFLPGTYIGTSTIITSQYDPRTWISFLESDGNFAMGDSIRRRLLNNGYTLLIEKAV